MSGMDHYSLKLARQCAPLLAIVILAACATQPSDITVQTEASAVEEKNSSQPQVKIDRQPVHPDVVYNVLAGEYLGGENDLGGSARAYADAASLSIDPDIAERASRIAYAAEEWEALDVASDRWVTLSPQVTDAHQLRAVAHLMHGRVQAGVKELNLVIGQIDDTEEAWLTVSALIGSIPDEKAVESVLNVFLATPDTNTPEEDRYDPYGQSVLAYRMGRHQLAYEMANYAADRSSNLETIRWAAQVAHAQGEREVALRHYRHGLELYPDERDLNLAYAELLRLNGEMELALTQLEQLESDSAILYTLAVYANSVGLQDRTAKYYRQLRQLDVQGDSEHFYFCGQVAEVLVLYEDAVYCYQRVESGDDVKAAKIRLAYALSQAEGAEEAIEYLQELQQLDDEELIEQAFVAEAEVLRQRGDLEGSLNRLSDGLAKLRDNPNLLYMRAIVAEAMGDYFLAEQDLRIIIQNDPNNAVALNALGYTLANRTDRYGEALSLIKRALSINPHDPATLDSMGWVMYRRGELDEAEQYLRRAYQGDQNAEIAAHLGEVLWQKGDEEEAKSVLQSAQQIDASNMALLEVLERLGIVL